LEGCVWISEWNAGQLAVYDPAMQAWKEWLPRDKPLPYAIYVDEQDIVWVSDFAANSLALFDPPQESFKVFALHSSKANVRQILGQAGKI